MVFNEININLLMIYLHRPPPFTPPPPHSHKTHATYRYLHTHMCTAGLDYQDTSQNLTFTSEGSQSVSISILDDFVVEDTESFLALLSSSDDFVMIGEDLADVFIQDNDGN